MNGKTNGTYLYIYIYIYLGEFGRIFHGSVDVGEDNMTGITEDIKA